MSTIITTQIEIAGILHSTLSQTHIQGDSPKPTYDQIYRNNRKNV